LAEPVTWINASGSEMQDENWSDAGMRCFGMLIDGRAQPTGVRQRGTEATMLLVVNGHFDLVEFTLPSAPGGKTWTRLVDTNVPDDREARLQDRRILRGDREIVAAVRLGRMIRAVPEKFLSRLHLAESP
jgi:pullulanase/glycogen debranching enzyme